MSDKNLYTKSKEVRPYPRRRNKRRRIISVSIIFALLLGIFGSFNVLGAIYFPYNSKNTAEITVDIPEASTASSIGKILVEHKVIKSALAFKLYSRFAGAENIQAGKHIVSQSMTMEEIMEALKSGAITTKKGVTRITFPEGLTLEAMSKIFAKATNYKEEDFMKVVQDQTFINNMATKYPKVIGEAAKQPNVRYILEGYLYPATYDFNQESTIESLVEQMIAMRVSEMEKYSADIASKGYTIHQILTMASLVEREGVTKEDREKIASTFYNRLAVDMPLQTDISVLYARNEHKEMVTWKDLEEDSPYNLYTHKGLGPGPYNSPSDGAIIATIYPANTNYLYFFADIKTGKVFFTDNFDQHLAWQKEYETTGTVQG